MILPLPFGAGRAGFASVSGPVVIDVGGTPQGPRAGHRIRRRGSGRAVPREADAQPCACALAGDSPTPCCTAPGGSASWHFARQRRPPQKCDVADAQCRGQAHCTTYAPTRGRCTCEHMNSCADARLSLESQGGAGVGVGVCSRHGLVQPQHAEGCCTKRVLRRAASSLLMIAHARCASWCVCVDAAAAPARARAFCFRVH